MLIVEKLYNKQDLRDAIYLVAVQATNTPATGHFSIYFYILLTTHKYLDNETLHNYYHVCLVSDTGEWRGLGATWQLMWQEERNLKFHSKNDLAPTLAMSAPRHF